MTLAVLSGLLGLFVAEAGIRLILVFKPGDLARLNEVGLDPRVLGWALAVCLLTGILIGLVPAITMVRGNFSSSVQVGGRSIAGGVAARGIRRALVITEFALAIIPLVGAGLLIRSLWSIENVDPGFRPDRVLSMQLAGPAFGATTQLADSYDRVLERIQSLPGIEGAGIIGFSAVALLMAAIGIHGLIQYSIATPTHEVGIRVAVGAQAGEIFRMIMLEGLKLSLTGLGLELLGALWLGRAGSSLLFGVTATDPLTFIAVSLLLIAVAAAACYFPARSAMNVDPIVALRQE